MFISFTDSFQFKLLTYCCYLSNKVTLNSVVDFKGGSDVGDIVMLVT